VPGKKVSIVLTASICVFSLHACAIPQPQENKGTNTGSASFSALLGQYENLTNSQRIDALESIQNSGSTSPADRQQACYMLARLMQKTADPKQAEQAIALYQTASDQSDLWQRCQLHIAECAAVTGQEKTARAALNALLGSKQTNYHDKASAQYALAQSYLRANEKDNAKNTFELVRQRFPKTEYAVGALYYLGTIANFRRYLTISPDGHFAADIVQQMLTAPGFKPAPHDCALFAQVYYLQGKFKDALQQWRQSHSDSRFVEQADCLQKLSDVAGAKQILQKGIYAHPNSANIVPAAQLYSRLSSRADALKIWQLVLKTSPRYADVALWNLANRQSPAQAIPMYRTLTYKYPNSKFAPDSSWWLIWYQSGSGKLSKKKGASTINALRQSLKRYGQSKAAPRFAFWIGKLEEALKQKDQAKHSYLWASRQFPSSYYGWRSRARLAALNGGHDLGWETKPGANCGNPNWKWPSEPVQIQFEDVVSKCGYTVAVLTMLKQWDEALQLIPQPQDPLVLAWCLANMDSPLEAINAAATGIQGVPQRNSRWQFAYPLLYGKSISSKAHSKQVDPCLIHALIREESRYFSHAVSHSGALGLMQLLPSTAAFTAKHCGISLNDMQDCFDSDKNIRLGTEYFAMLQQRFKGNDLLAVAAYNGGPGAVDDWKSTSDPDAFVENIPFDETRDYIRKVFDSYWNYKQIYN
jgi:TolA-binding protein